MATEEIDLTGGVSDAELFSSVAGKAAPEAETPVLEIPAADEPEDEPETVLEVPLEPEETETQPEKQRQPRRTVPLKELLDERDEKRELKAQLEAARQENQRFIAEQQRRAQEAQAAQARPDPYADPEGYIGTVTQQLEQKFLKRFLDSSFEAAHSVHGEKFQTAFDTLFSEVERTGDVRLRDQIINAANPGAAVMKWHAAKEAEREVGGDLAAYRERLRKELLSDAEFRKTVLEAERTARTPAPAGRTFATAPSLNNMAAAVPNAAGDAQDMSDPELFSYAMRAPRKQARR